MKSSPRHSALWIVPLFVLIASSVSAQAPLGEEFRVNSTTNFDQSAPEIATDFDGAFIAVWADSSQDGDARGIFAQIFDEEGELVDQEIQINSNTDGDQFDPNVSMTDDERFAVVWVGPDQDQTGIFLRIFNADGVTTQEDIPVNTTQQGGQVNPVVAFAQDGVVMVVWEGPDADGLGIFGRIFDELGDPQTEEFDIPDNPTGDQMAPAVDDVDEDGTFIVAWEGEDDDGLGIFARAIDDLGDPLAQEIAVNTTMQGDQVQPVIGVESNDDAKFDNGFVLAWQGPDGDGNGIFAQFFDEEGFPLGDEIRINQTPAGEQFDPDISIDDDGDALITWSEADPDNLPVTGPGQSLRGVPILIRGRRVLTGSLRLGEENFPEFTIASGILDFPAVATEANGDFVVLWENAFDGDGSGIFGLRYGLDALFVDGFESGDVSEWTTSVP